MAGGRGVAAGPLPPTGMSARRGCLRGGGQLSALTEFLSLCLGQWFLSKCLTLGETKPIRALGASQVWEEGGRLRWGGPARGWAGGEAARTHSAPRPGSCALLPGQTPSPDPPRASAPPARTWRRTRVHSTRRGPVLSWGVERCGCAVRGSAPACPEPPDVQWVLRFLLAPCLPPSPAKPEPADVSSWGK